MAAIAVAGCSQSAGEKAEAEYEAAKNSGASQAQLCRSAKAVAQAYSRAGDAEAAAQWQDYAQIDCSLAYFTEGYRY